MLVFIIAAAAALLAFDQRALYSIQQDGLKSVLLKCALAALAAVILIPFIVRWQPALAPHADSLSPYFGLIVYGLAFGAALKIWFQRRVAPAPAPGSESADKTNDKPAEAQQQKVDAQKSDGWATLLSAELPWVLLTGTVFLLAVYSAPEFGFLRELRGLKAGVVELEFHGRIQAGKAERFQLFRLTGPNQISLLADRYQAILDLDDRLLAEQSSGSRPFPMIDPKRAKELHVAHGDAQTLFEKVLLPVFKCGRAAEQHAPASQVYAALGVLPNRIWQFLQTAESRYEPKLLQGTGPASGPTPHEVEKAFERLVVAAKEANASMRRLGELPAASPLPAGSQCADEVVPEALDAGAPHRYRLLQSPSLYRVLAFMYSYAGRPDFVPAILDAKVLQRYEWDSRLPVILADSYAHLPQPDLDSAIHYAELALSRVDRIDAFFGRDGPPYLQRVRAVAQNNLAFFLAEAVRETPRAILLARQSLDAMPSQAGTHTLAFAVLVDAVNDPKLSSSEKKAAVAQAVSTLQAGLLKAKTDRNLHEEQWFRLHLHQARDIYQALN